MPSWHRGAGGKGWGVHPASGMPCCCRTSSQAWPCTQWLGCVGGQLQQYSKVAQPAWGGRTGGPSYQAESCLAGARLAGPPPKVEHNLRKGGPVARLLVPAAVQQRGIGCQPFRAWGVARQPLSWRHLQPAALDDPAGLLQAGRQAGRQRRLGTSAPGSTCTHSNPSIRNQCVPAPPGSAHLPGVEASCRPRHLPRQQLPQHHAKGKHV